MSSIRTWRKKVKMRSKKMTAASSARKVKLTMRKEKMHKMKRRKRKTQIKKMTSMMVPVDDNVNS